MVSISRGRLGCENCRSRRIKCNQLRPRCSQCARAGLQCSGYRTLLDLVFQDQTARIAQKYPATDMTLHGKARHHNPTFFVPAMPMEDIALQHYMEQFTITSGPSPLRGQELPKIIVTSVISVGLAALAAAHRDPHLMQLARRKYATALRLLARAIHDPERSLGAHTATSSFNLSMFEV
ncbi:Zn(II)2Cys6 transcription factor domain-containing protein [Aspergillus novofumigatus IBT 16806]|uniref:C6 zinc finger domain protein n=1 Tax=Aspergillus novofumigatus (strain IBT 16806) TaxID=1392255 RepID=A0A2I1CCP6_ASPN1|nr:C6 zinc finger domain protein [Aspergillus novofumigatus IBT 16806]PKX95376.1 C6 zinc finger domain protein [Aspergillus novofumigatus IBT 16806]